MNTIKIQKAKNLIIENYNVDPINNYNSNNRKIIKISSVQFIKFIRYILMAEFIALLHYLVAYAPFYFFNKRIHS